MAILTSSFTGKMYYLNFDSDGNMFIPSKEYKEGYVERINPMNGVQNGYKKIIPFGVSGYLNNLSIAPVKISNGGTVEFLYITFKDYENDEYYRFSFPIFSDKGKINRYVKSFVKYYPNIDISRMLRFNSFKRKPEDEFAPSNLAIAYYNGKERADKDDMIPMYYKSGQNGWPGPQKEINRVTKKEETSYDEQNAFAYEKIKEFVKDFSEKIGPVREMLEKTYGVKSSGNNHPVSETAVNNAASQPVQHQPQQPQGYAQGQQYTQQPQGYTQHPQQQAYAGRANAPQSDPKPTPPPAPPIYGEDDLPF